MNVNEFSVRFDLLWQNVMSDKAPNINEYEKSVFLTKAQEIICKSIYNGSIGTSFEQTEFNRRALDALIKDVEIKNREYTNNRLMTDYSILFKLPDDVWFITYEDVELNTDDCHKGKRISVKPVTQDEFDRCKNNPFKGPNDRRALRLDYNDDKVEIVSKYDVSCYYVRYIKRPRPIILMDLEGTDLSIDGFTEVTECELDPLIHENIIETAVNLAKQVFE